MIYVSDGLKYMSAPMLVRPQSILAVLACHLVLIGVIEAYRVNGGPFTGRDFDLVYPSRKRFDPPNLADDPDVAAVLKVKEIRKGCLAKLSMIGYYVQAAADSQGLVENWASHIADPFAVNRVTLEIDTQYTLSVAMFAAARINKAAAPKVNLSGRRRPDSKKGLGPNTVGSCVPDYLTAEYPGDYGWDSAGLAADPKPFEHLREALVLLGRWALLGTLPCTTPEQ